MATTRIITDLPGYLANVSDSVTRGRIEAMLIFLAEAEANAKRQAIINFSGRNNRKLSGRLLNSIYTGLKQKSDNEMPVGILGTRGIPYARIHEYGGKIYPKKAKHLWLKQWGGDADQFRRMTPREFIAAKQTDPKHFKMFRSKRGNLIAAYEFMKGRSDPEIVPLFVLKDSVEMPERSFLRVGINKALLNYPQIARQRIAMSMRRTT
jgi:phage gpG-like protein